MFVNASRKKYLEHYRNQNLFEQINAAYIDDDQEEKLTISNAYFRSIGMAKNDV